MRRDDGRVRTGLRHYALACVSRNALKQAEGRRWRQRASSRWRSYCYADAQSPLELQSAMRDESAGTQRSHAKEWQWHCQSKIMR